MGGTRVLAVSVLLAACGGKKPPAKPVDEPVAAKPAPHLETAADRDRKRHDAALAIVPAGSTCLPAALKAPNGPRLELAGIGADAVLCAIDTDPARLLGPIGCWKLDLRTIDAKTNAPGLVYQDPTPLPGHDLDVKLESSCARGYCVPGASDPVAHMAWSLDGKTVAVLVGGSVHVFDASSKAEQSTFSVKTVASPVAVYLAGDSIFVEGRDDTSDTIWGFKLDGTASGTINAMGKGDKPVSLVDGSFSIIDDKRVALAEHDMDTLTTYDTATGKRTKAVRKPSKQPATHLAGATAVMGKSNLLVVYRGDRLGELGVLDPHSLVESKKSFHLPWCDAAADEAPPPQSRSATKKSSDPEEGGN